MDEDQYILRLPPPLVERMRFALSSNKRKDAAGEDKKVSTFRIDFVDERTATLTVDEEVYPATLVDMPAIMETHKTADKRTFYKSGDVHQMLIVRMPNDEPPDEFQINHGLTPAAKEAGRRLAEAPRTYPLNMVKRVETRIKQVIDRKITFKQKHEPPPPPPHPPQLTTSKTNIETEEEEEEEEVLFEEETSDTYGFHELCTILFRSLTVVYDVHTVQL